MVLDSATEEVFFSARSGYRKSKPKSIKSETTEKTSTGRRISTIASLKAVRLVKAAALPNAQAHLSERERSRSNGTSGSSTIWGSLSSLAPGEHHRIHL